MFIYEGEMFFWHLSYEYEIAYLATWSGKDAPIFLAVKMSVYSVYLVDHQVCGIAGEDYKELYDRLENYNKGRENICFVSSPEDADIIIVIEQYSYKTWKYSEDLLSSPLVTKYPEKLFSINIDSYGRGFLPGIYTSLNKANYDSCYHRAACYIDFYNKNVFSVGPEAVKNAKPAALCAFQGNIATDSIRRKMVKVLDGNKRANIVHQESKQNIAWMYPEQDKTSYVDNILSAYFSLCPRGISPSSYRIYETMALSRCPVIISDDWIEPEEVDWNAFSLRIKEKDVYNIAEILRARTGDALAMGLRARRVWEEKFSEEIRYATYIDKIIEIKNSWVLGGEGRRCQHRWKTRSFYKSNGWTIEQRIMAKIKKMIFEGVC